MSISIILHIKTNSVPVYSATLFTIAEHYCKPIQQAYNIIYTESPETLDDVALQM